MWKGTRTRRSRAPSASRRAPARADSPGRERSFGRSWRRSRRSGWSMSNTDDRYSDALRAYNTPPELSAAQLDQMWSGIEAEAFPRRFVSPSVERQTAGAARWLTARQILPLAAVLLLGVAIGRYSAKRPSTSLQRVAARPAADTVAVPEPYQSTTSRYLGQTAALLVALPNEIRAGRADDRFLSHA